MLDFQRQWIAASLHDFTPNATFANYCGGQYGSESYRWRAAVVDFLCAGLRCGLIELTHKFAINEKRDSEGLRNLLTYGDVAAGIDTSILWDILYFNGTQQLVEIVKKYGLHDWDSFDTRENREFVIELGKLLSPE